MPGFPAATEITPEGYLYTGSAEVLFRFGPRLRPWDVHTRLLTDGRYPVLHSAATAGPVRYTLSTFAARVAGGPVDFVRVSMHNSAGRAARAGWAIATRYTGGARKPNGLHRFRFARPATPARTGLYYQPGYGWNPQSSYGFRGRAFLRDGRAVYVTRRTPRGFHLGRSRGPRHPGVRTIMGVSSYRGRIAPGHTVRLDFVVPVVPVDRTTGAYKRIAVARFPHFRARVLG
ncbi:MAG TPA: hypothetical protein VFO24_09060, partial [Usitatibacter sp.]|nr:hypothetical protein [Usitatibacter sp.]